MIQSYPWYIADWRESETRITLSLAERGLYRELLDYCYLEGSLPIDHIRLSRLCCCSPEEFESSWPAVVSLFQLDGERFTHAKVNEVRTKLEAYHEQKRHAGSASGQARRQRPFNGRSNETPTHLQRPFNGRSNETPTHLEPPPSPSPAPSPAPAPRQSARDETPEIGERLYKPHPKKRGIDQVLGALRMAISRGNCVQDIEACHAAWCESAEWRKDDGRFVPSLADWLHNDGFTKWPAGKRPAKPLDPSKYIEPDYERKDVI